MMSWSVSERRREFAIRVALGVRRSVLLAPGARARRAWLALAGTAIGVLAARAAAGVLTGLLYGVPRDRCRLVRHLRAPALALGRRRRLRHPGAPRAARRSGHAAAIVRTRAGRVWQSPAQQADELAEDHRRRAPDLVAAQIEVGILDREPFARARAVADVRGVLQIVDRHFDHFLDFVRGRLEVGALVGDADDRVEREAADEHVDGRQLAEHADAGGIDADLFVRLAQRRLRRASPRRRSRRPAG